MLKYQKRVYKANWRLSTFFQIDVEVIRMIRSEDFSFSFAENIREFIILRRDIGKIRSVTINASWVQHEHGSRAMII